MPPVAVEQRPQLQYRAPGVVRAATGVIVLIPLALVPQIVGDTKLGFFTIGLTQVAIILSLGLLVRTSGQVSLCHAAFAAIGATTFSQLAVAAPPAVVRGPDPRRHWWSCRSGRSSPSRPFGCPGCSWRWRPSASACSSSNSSTRKGFMFTTLQSGRPMPRPSFAQTDKGYYYLVLGAVVVVSLLIVGIIRSRLGRVLRGLSESPVAATTMGLSTNTTRVIVFCISAFLAGIGGILYGGAVNFATTSDIHFALVPVAGPARRPGAGPLRRAVVRALHGRSRRSSPRTGPVRTRRIG